MTRTWTRADLTFASGDGSCAAWLYTPSGVTREAPGPVLVMAHGLGGLRTERLDAFAERFAAAGYSCLVFDYRTFGASPGEPRELLDIARQREDWRAAVAVARTLPTVDPDRVVVWGTSFSGGHVLVTAAEDPRIAAAVSQCPFTDGLASALAMDPLTSVRVTALGLADLAATALGRGPVRVPNYGRPGSVALMTALDAAPGFEALMPDAAAGPKRVPARIALQVPLAFPGRRAKDVRCPLHVVVCERDTVAPAKQTRRHVERAPRAEVLSYDTGHFDIYVGEWFERNVADQLAFLARHVTIN